MSFTISNPFRTGDPFSRVLPASALHLRRAESAGQDASAPSPDVHDKIQSAANAVVDALGKFAVTPPPLLGVGVTARTALATLLKGHAARLAGVGGSASLLSATQAVNTQTTTDRASSSALGLDLSTALSTLRSQVLGLDITTPGAASKLLSSSALGLDVTSAAAASVLASSAALGLDLTSPDAASVLASARALGLDLTSPEVASQLYSASLGLDLTSPNAVSTLQSALALGLDMTSPETVSRLASASTLGLDVTTPDAASRLGSSGMLGLDVTSPSRASLLRSAAVLGLDLTSADAASHLTSSSGVGLDTTSPEVASQLISSMLGLNLTSPDAASKLSSTNNLGLDTTSPQTASTLDSSAGLGLDITSPQTSSVLKSSATLGLDVTSPQVSSTITSTAAVNATTSYSPNLAMSAGTASVTLSGTYAGTSPSLTVKMMTNATLGSTATGVHFQVLDSTNHALLDYTGNLKAGDKVYLGDSVGLYLTLGAGTIVNNATATTAASTSASTIDATAAFNGTSAPLFDNNRQVTAGTFTINGTQITVNAGDSINSVINSINTSAAGVTASFANNKLTITTNAASEDTINFGTDTSGFLAAMKLAAPNEQINAATTSYSSNTLAFANGTSVATLSGTYLGTGAYASATSLTVKLQTSLLGLLGGAQINANTAQTVKFAVLDQAGHTLFSFSGSLKAGDKVAIDNESGLWISFSAGTINNGDTATTTVSKTTGTDVDPNAAFNATGNAAPRWESGYTVGAGSFTVNGVSINVAANDTINTVLAKINSSSAGVTASIANDKITITNNAGSNPVQLGNDTSGFLAATKLSMALTTKGNIRDDLQVLSKTTQFANVTTGSFSINGVAISVNKDTDSLSSIISRINGSAAGVTASYDSVADKVVLTTIANSEDLISISGDTSGFATAAKLSSSNTVKGNIRDDQQVLAKTTQFGTVATGSFTINGVTISVNKDTDTLTSIINRINSSAAGVTASFDGTANKLHLVTNAISEDLITVANDTSGFLTAAKLASGNTVKGNIRDDQQFLAKTTQFGAVATGSFTINGVTIAVNKDTDTLTSIINRINTAASGVTAAYDATSGKVVLTGTTNSEDLISVGNDTSHFLAAAQLATNNTVRGHLREDTVALYDLSRYASVVNGSFVVDGKTVAVSTSDTIQSIVSKINSSGARVTAAFDATSNTIKLATTYNTEDLLPIGSDTSGFLAASGISSANTIKGNIKDDQQFLSKTTQFAGVTSGSFTINGTAIAINKDTDTLASIISRINASAAGVTAAYNATNDTVTLTTLANTEDLISLTDSTGFLSALHLATNNTVRGHLREDGVALYDLSGFQSVTNGSFVVDGKTISVSTSDSINAIVARINASGARVTASYDTSADKLVLTTTYNTEDLVPVGSDTSGFLAAAHLDAANTVRGNLPDDQQVLAKTTQFGAVTSGTFTINGTTISVNKDTDTLTSIINQINASAAGVTASYDSVADKINLVGTTASEDLINVGNDTTGFLTAAKLASANTVRGNIADDRQVLAKTTQFGAVGTGSFTINGVAIAVNKDTDTLESIIGRINASGAGVTAAYDATADVIRLATLNNTEDLIDVGNDTSGFLAAAKLSSNNTVRGNIRDDQQVLAKTTQFGSVATGSFTINGVTIAVNKDTDTFASLVDRINAAGAGVTAAYDSSADKLVLTGTTASEDLINVGGDSSGFLAAAHLSTSNTVRGHLPEDGVVLADLARFQGVTSGSFVVDGHTISLDVTQDTIQSLVAKINTSGARVTASFDAATNKIGLQTTFNTEDEVAIGSDTTGFLAAAGIDAANTIRGNLRDDRQVLSKTTQFGTVASGSFTINGVAVTIDAANDSLTSVIQKINDAGAGVTAAYDATNDVLKLTSTTNGEDLIDVGNDATGFLAAAHLASENTVRGHLPEDTVALRDVASFASVADGSFTIDGKTIAVDIANDTIQSLVAKINASGARVTASYDAASDGITLAATYDSEDQIPIGSDTSGFLAAAHLDPANTVLGNIRDDQQVLAKTSQFSAVTSGSFTVNGATISVDTAHDSLTDIVARINASAAGVTASYDATADKLSLVSNANSEDLIDVGNDTTGFLSAAHLDAQNTVRGNLPDDQQVLAKTSQFAGVTSGSFTVNGTAIALDANVDTVESMIAKINESGAGVTAAYDSAADRIVFTNTAVGADLVQVAGDTTGFLAAAGLATENGVAGKLADDAERLSRTTQFAGVSDGSFSVNGHVISVTADADSLESIVGRINAANAGVTAAYNSITDRLEFTPTTAGAPLALDSDTSGFLAAAHVALGDVGTRVNADAAFNATGLSAPMFDPGQSVQAGSFTINGVAINVAANDSINSVIAHINASRAGVTATFDANTQTIKLAAKQAAAAPIIAGNDTSGFLAAVKLDGTAQSLAGTDPTSATTARLRDMPEYSDVTAGTLTVNGVDIAIDPATTTLAGLAQSLNAIDGVVASVDSASGDFQLAAAPGARGLSVRDDSGLLENLGITRAMLHPRHVVPSTSPTDNADSVIGEVQQAAEQFNAVLDAYSVGGSGVQASLESAVDLMRSSGATGISLTGGSDAPRLSVDVNALRSSLQARGTSFQQQFAPAGALTSVLGSLFDQFATTASATTADPLTSLLDNVKAAFVSGTV